MAASWWGEGAGATVGEGAVGRGCLSGLVARGQNWRGPPRWDGSDPGVSPPWGREGSGQGLAGPGGPQDPCVLSSSPVGRGLLGHPGRRVLTHLGLFLIKGLRTGLGLQLTKASSCENGLFGVTVPRSPRAISNRRPPRERRGTGMRSQNGRSEGSLSLNRITVFD